jgi:hypothetical protein
MAYGGGAAAAGAAAAAAIANATKASGGIVRVESKDFAALVGKANKPAVVMAGKTFWSAQYKYLMNYRGLFLYTKSRDPLMLPSDVEIILAKSIWIPN